MKIVADSQGKIRQRIFYENVRDYQGLRNSVNSEIRHTLKQETQRDKFILLNNGITIVTRNYKSLGSNNYAMRDFQVVNDCQTSYEIFNAQNSLENVLIPVKVIHTNDPEVITMIVRATNRQTPVPDETFIALSEYHKRLQDLLFLRGKYCKTLHNYDSAHVTI